MILSSSFLWAQDSTRVNKQKELFIGLGSGHYRGDLGNQFGSGQALFNIGIKLNNNKKLNGNFSLNIGSISGNELDYTFDDDSGISTNPNTYFKTTFFSINYEAQYNIVDKKKFKLYLSQGIGVLRFIPRDEFENDLSDNTESRSLNETYRNLAVMLPTSIGIKYILPNNMGIGFQSGFYNSLTDYLDNISVWGQNDGNDNILNFRLHLYVPVNF